jgi:hypothetical protein
MMTAEDVRESRKDNNRYAAQVSPRERPILVLCYPYSNKLTFQQWSQEVKDDFAAKFILDN